MRGKSESEDRFYRQGFLSEESDISGMATRSGVTQPSANRIKGVLIPQ